MPGSDNSILKTSSNSELSHACFDFFKVGILSLTHSIENAVKQDYLRINKNKLYSNKQGSG